MVIRYSLTLEEIFELLSLGRVYNSDIENYSYNDAEIFYKKILYHSSIVIKFKHIDNRKLIFFLDNKEIFAFYKYYKNLVRNKEEQYKILERIIYLEQHY